MAGREKVAALAPPQIAAPTPTSSPPRVDADQARDSESLDELARPAREGSRVRSLLNLQQSYGNYFAAKAIAEYRARAGLEEKESEGSKEPSQKDTKRALAPATGVDEKKAAPPAPPGSAPAPEAGGAPGQPGGAAAGMPDGAQPVPAAPAAKPHHGRVAPAAAASGGSADAPTTSLEGWKSKVHSATARLKADKITTTAQVANIQQAGGSAVAKQRAQGLMLPKKGKSAVSPPPKVDGSQPLIPPKVDPVPEATAAVQAASDKPLPTQSIPPLVESPRHNMPQIGPEPTPAPHAKAGDPAAPDMKPEAAHDKDPKQQGAEKANAPLLPKESPINMGPGGEMVIEDKGGPRPPEPALPPIFKSGIANALARLLQDPKAEAENILDQVRGHSYDGKLKEKFPKIGESSVDELTSSLSSELDGIRKEAGISEDEIKTAVERRQKEIEKEKEEAQGQTAKAGEGEKQKLGQAGSETLDIVAGTRQNLDQATEEKLAQAKGDNDPEVVKLRRERLINEARKSVARQVVFYDQAGKKRHDQIGQVISLQRVAYGRAVKLDMEQVAQQAGTPEAAKVWPYSLMAAESRNWGNARLRDLEQLTYDKGKETDHFVSSLQKSVRESGQKATELIRTWADGKLNEHRYFWERIWQMFTDWAGQAKAEAEAWETARNQETRDVMAGDMNFLGGVVLSAGDELSEQAKGNIHKLSQEQQAIVRTYYGLDENNNPIAGAKDARNPIAAIAAGLRARVISQRAPKIVEQFMTELEKSDDWEALEALGQTENPRFNATYVCKEVHQALHGGITGWNDEPRVFRALSGLSKVQSLACRKLYRLPEGAGGWEMDLDEDLKDQLTGTFKSDSDWERAKAELEGDQTTADVASLREAMHGGLTGWGTDEKAIMDTLRGKSVAERERIKDLYFQKYGIKLEDDLKDELTGTFEDEHDYDRAQALMQGDTDKADGIAIDQAMYGGITGWGTDRKAIEDVYDQVRKDVERDLQKRDPPPTTKELEAEVKRRYEQIESAYNVTYAAKWDSTNESGLRQAYKDELSDGELTLVNAIADNDIVKADAARIQVEKESLFYADDDVINGVLKHQYERALEDVRRDKGPELEKKLQEEKARANPPWTVYDEKVARLRLERQLEADARVVAKQYMNQLEKTYDTDFKGNLRYDLEMNMSGMELQEARKRVAQGGWLTPAQEIHFATEDLGTKEEMLTKAIEGRTKEEIEEIRKEWNRMHPNESLEDCIKSETSGRLEFELLHKLEGEPMTMEDEMKSMRELVEHEREHDSWTTSGELARMNYHYQQMQDRYKAANEPGLSDDERARRIAKFQNSAGHTNVSVEDHKESLESITNGLVTAVTTAIALVLAGVAIVFSGGTATPGVVAALATWWGAAAAAMGTALIGMGIKQVMLGSDYGIEDVGVDLAVGGVEAAAAAATAGLSKAATSSVAERFAESMAKNAPKAEREALKQAIIKTLEENPAMVKRGILGTLAHSESRAVRMVGHGASGALFGAAGAVPSGAARTILDSKTWEGGGAWEKILHGSVAGIPQGALFGGALGMLGGVHGSGGRARAPEIEEGARPAGPKDVPPAGGHTAETLREGLPPDLQRKVPITVDPELQSNTVRVHYEVDEAGVFRDITIRAGPQATPRDIELHVRTVRTMQKYAGLQGGVRALIAKARAYVTRSGSPPSGRFLEAQLEVEKLPAIIDDHMAQLADPDLAPKQRAEIEADLAHRQDQLRENQAILDGTIAEGEARGYVAAEGREKGPAVAEPEEGAAAARKATARSGEPQEKVAPLSGEVIEEPGPAAGPSGEAPTPSKAKASARALEVADLSGKVAETEASLKQADAQYESLRRREMKLESWIEAAQARGKKPFQGYVEQLAETEIESQKVFAERSRLSKELFETRMKLNEISGTPQENADWAKSKYSDLGNDNANICFAPGTPVHTPNGLRRIEDLGEGDLVFVHNFATERVESRRVNRTVRGRATHLQCIAAGHEEIWATRLHRFWEKGVNAWVEARGLWPGDTLLSVYGSSADVSSVRMLTRDTDTFNLEIDGIHNYFVGEAGVLVHNGGEDEPETAEATAARFSNGVRENTKIYLVTRKNPATGQWEPFYVGKTVQGKPGSVAARFKQHLAEKGLWRAEYQKSQLRVEPIKEGSWTEFETAVWEEHYIRLYGGLRKEDGLLVNARHEITQEKYEAYRDGYAHNPCAGR